MLLALVLLIGVAAAETAQQLPPNPESPDKPKIGRWQETPARAPSAGVLGAEELEALSALGYLGTSSRTQRMETVTVNDAAHSSPGYTLVVSAHDFEASLVDMSGHPVHTWRYLFHEAYPTHPVSFNSMWFMAHLMPGGDLLVLQHGFGIFRLTRNSELVWGATCFAHHDFAVNETGETYVLESRQEVVPEFDPDNKVINDRVSRFSAAGEPLGTVSLLDALAKGGEKDLLARVRAWLGEEDEDVLHTNSIEILDGSHADGNAAFARGNLLISCRSPNALIILDFEKGEVVWSMTGAFRSQHSASMLPNGNVLLFDNQGEAGRSVVRELRPADGEEVWSYRGSENAPFYSEWNGRCHRLENGNTLMAESLGGRAFEVMPSGKIVWEYWNPHRAGADQQFIARVFEVKRYPEDSVKPWLAPASLSSP